MEERVDNLVSIIMPVYNGTEFLEQSLNSVINQDYVFWELVIIDDKSSDNSSEIIKLFAAKDRRINAIFLDENKGVANARNVGISVAKGTYISFLDCDDVWLLDKLSTQISFMQRESLVMTYSAYYVINKSGDRTSIIKVKDSLSYKDMLKSNQIGNLTGIYNSMVLGKVYFQNIGHEDYLFWLEIFKKIQSTKGIIQPLAEYRLHQGSLSRRKFKAATWHWSILRHNLKLNLILSLLYFGSYILNGLKKRFFNE